MKSTWTRIVWLVPALVAAAMVAGCGGGEPTKPKRTAPKTATLELDGFSGEIKGSFVYDGEPPDPEDAPKLSKENKDYKACHPDDKPVKGPGWYVNKENKGVQMLVVYLKTPEGADMEVKDEWKKLPEGWPKFKEIRQPHCQFEPRVTVLHPEQNVRAYNDDKTGGNVTHDFQLSGATSFQIKMDPNTDKEVEVQRADDRPSSIGCGAHTGMMTGYIWKFTHPYADATDKDGKFKLIGAPVFKGDTQMELWVWHEKTGHRKVGDLKGIKKDQPFEFKEPFKIK